MDSKELRGLCEAYSEVYASQEEIEEAVKGESSERRKNLAAERRAGHRPLPAKEGEKYASHKLSQMAYAKRRRMGEELDIFDVVLEFLQVEGFAETLEEAEWMMANIIDDEAIDIILGEEFELDEAEGSYGATPKAYSAASKTKMTAKRKPFLKKMQSRTNPANRTDPYGSPRKGLTADDRERARAGSAHGVGTRQDHDYPSEGPGGVTKSAKKLRKQKAMGEFAKEAFEAWLDEAMTNYEKNRKRAAQRAAARNAARDQGKTGAVPGVGYVTPRRERETWTDESGKTRHAKGL